ncbi:hypothetical protein [Blautia sp. An81]|uniref:hypothetical protein n=1 Tax=Blautia sp. An81 TaxID=1965659 RepID=UPI001177ED0B|nr:hypothetical protein [Blautia sp. An81]
MQFFIQQPGKGVTSKSSSLALIPSTGFNDGSSFQKDFFLLSSSDQSANRASYFSINDQNRSQWKEIPTTLPSEGTILGYREVFYMDDSPHAMVKVTELFPITGRQHFAFYNINVWSSWTSIAPS